MNLRSFFENENEDRDLRRVDSGGRKDPENSRSMLQTAAFALSIGCVLTFLMVYISVPLGALAIILALLSRGREGAPARSKTVITLAVAGMTVSTVITAYAFYRVKTDPVLNSQMRQMVEYYTYTYLGESASQAMPWLFKDEEGLYPGQTQSQNPDQEQRQEKSGEKETKETQPAWSDDLLNDHDKLMEYFLTPQDDNKSDDTYHPEPFPNEDPEAGNDASTGTGAGTSSSTDGGDFT